MVNGDCGPANFYRDIIAVEQCSYLNTESDNP